MVVNDSLDRKLQKDKSMNKWVTRLSDWKFWGMALLCIFFPPLLLFIAIRGIFRWMNKASETKTELKAQTMMRENERKEATVYSDEDIEDARNPVNARKREAKRKRQEEKDRDKPYSWAWWLGGVALLAVGLIVLWPLALIGFLIAVYQSVMMTVDTLTPNKK